MNLDSVDPTSSVDINRRDSVKQPHCQSKHFEDIPVEVIVLVSFMFLEFYYNTTV